MRCHDGKMPKKVVMILLFKACFIATEPHDHLQSIPLKAIYCVKYVVILLSFGLACIMCMYTSNYSIVCQENFFFFEIDIIKELFKSHTYFLFLKMDH